MRRTQLWSLLALLSKQSGAFVPNARFTRTQATLAPFVGPNLGLSASVTTDSSLAESTNGGGDGTLPVNGEAEEEEGEEELSPFLDESSDLLDALPDGDALPAEMTTLPRHSHAGVNTILEHSEKILKNMHRLSKKVDRRQLLEDAKKAGRANEKIYSNSYIDLGKIDHVGFDFDYTLVMYTDVLLELIYEMALKRLVMDRQYPLEMLESGLKYDPFFSIRGLAVDKDTGWICHLSYTHKVAVAWEGREKVSTSRIFREYRGKRALRPNERKKRLKPLNDIFSMAECCLIADTIQFFKDRSIPYCPQNAVTDVLSAIRETHVSGDFHRLVANNPETYFANQPHLKQVIKNLKDAGKRLIFVSNSPFWYVDAGMRYTFGKDWRDEWDAVITSKYEKESLFPWHRCEELTQSCFCFFNSFY